MKSNLKCSKALNQGVHWLTRVCQVVWCFGRALKDWQTGVIIAIHKKGYRRKCTNYRGISLPRLPGNAKCLEKRCGKIIEWKLDNTQCSFCLDCSTTDQIFTHQHIFEKYWKNAKDVYTCFIELESIWPGSLWKGLGSDTLLNSAVTVYLKSLYYCSEVCVHVRGVKSQLFTVGVGLRQEWYAATTSS